MTTNSGLCKSQNCVTKVGQQDPLSAINAAADAFEKELDTGVYTVNNIPSLNALSSETAVVRVETPIQRQIRVFGAPEFYEAVAAVNIYFERSEIQTITKDYPLVFQRVQGPPFSPIEIASFMDEYQYIPRNLVFQSGILNNKLLTEFENFYTRNISSSVIGSFCALMPNVFDTIDSFFTTLSNIESFASNLSINLRSLLSNLKNQLAKTIDRIVENIRNIILNFSIENVIKEVKTFVQEKIVLRFFALRESILSFFSEENIKNIKARINTIIDYVSKVFENPTLEDIQYLIYRFCNFASFIENSFNSLLDPLRGFRTNLENAVEIIEGRSTVNTSRAIAAGATRLTPEEKERKIAQAPSKEVPSDSRRVFSLGIIVPISNEERASVTQWNNGNGDDKIKFGDGLQTGNMGESGWTNVDLDVRALLMRVQSRFGKPLVINSGYRSANYNAQLRPPGAKNSFHISGLALDVTWRGFSNSTAKEFIKIAIEEGFSGIGGYKSFIHIDVGPKRSWGNLFGIVYP
jgi:hypothetical protein